MKENNDNKARTWCMLCHLTSLVGLLGVPFGHLLGPLVVWLIKRNEIPAVDGHGKESLNFQISMTIYMVIAVLLMFVVIGFGILPVLIIADVILVIIASVKASSGEKYRYPLTLRFIT